MFFYEIISYNYKSRFNNDKALRVTDLHDRVRMKPATAQHYFNQFEKYTYNYWK